MDNTLLSSKISCLLLEDDQLWLGIMEETLKLNFPQIEVHSFTNIAEANSSYALNKQMLLILDVNLPDGSSLEWLQHLHVDRTRDLRVIFTTAYADHAVAAFRFSALDFLLKPYLPIDLVEAVHKAGKSFDEQHYKKQLEAFIHNYTEQNKEEKKIILKTVEEIFVIKVSEILSAEADNSYTRFFLKNGQIILVSQSLKEFDQQLTPSGFIRVHQSHLVNLKHIAGYKKKTNMILLDGGLQIPVSQNKKIKVMEYLNSL